ncbi:MAG: polymer-forming cytoskeletal protein [Hyphomicrobiaceae bacterium]|nr:polymer-forming cytoskeletal protein [Hyphomicrobiaceae bacterium]
MPDHEPIIAGPPAADMGPTRSESVIGRDLKILGGGLRLISEGNLIVDGVVEGDVLGAHVSIGRHGQVNGLVHGETVSIEGQVRGMVRAVDVTLKNGADVEADVHHNTLSLEMGANFEGRSRRYAERDDLLPDLARAASEAPQEAPAMHTGVMPLTMRG